MNRVSCVNGVMEGNVFIDVDVNVLRPTAFAKWTNTAEEVSWYGERCPTTADQSWWWFMGNLTANRYIDQILRPHLLPILNRQREIFQHDNARPNTARATRDYLTNQNVNVLLWPSKSPDLNPIEHLWDEFDRRVRLHQQPPLTLAQLANALQDEWRRIPQAKIRQLVQSMPRRSREVATARGGVTRY